MLVTGWIWLIVIPHGRGAAPVIPESVARSARQRVEYGYSAGIAIGMINRDGRTFAGYGEKRLGDGVAPDEKTVFEIGSVTKVFTSILLADAVARGEVLMDDPVQALLPANVVVPSGNREITLEDLATQRSGLPTNPSNLCTDDPTAPFGCYSTEKLYEFLNGYTLSREPGLAWEYSNTGMGLLGHALARKAGKDYETLLRERILEPLGLRSTRTAVGDDASGDVAVGYSGVLQRAPFRIPGLEGAGALRSTVDDMLTFLAFNLGLQETPLSSVLNDAHKRRTGTSYPGVGIGLGWWLWGLPGGEVTQHSGDTFGFTAFVAFHKEKGVGVVILSNARSSAYSLVTDMGLNLLDPQYPLTSIRRPTTIDVATLPAFTGVFRAESGDLFEFGVISDHLVAFHPASKFEMTLHPQSTRRFAAVDLEVGNNTSAFFQVDSENRVMAMQWTQGGRTTTYPWHAAPARIVVETSGERRRFGVVGGSGAGFDIEATMDRRTWTPIGAVATPTDRVEDTDFSAGGFRFYRAHRRY